MVGGSLLDRPCMVFRMAGLSKTVNRVAIAEGRRGRHNLHTGFPNRCSLQSESYLVTVVRGCVKYITNTTME